MRSGSSWFKVLLIVILIAIIAGTGVYAVKARSLAIKTLDQANAETSATTPPKSSLPPLSATTNWTLYNNEEGSFSLKYPSNWLEAPTSKLCPSGMFVSSIYLSPDTASSINCPKDLLSQIYVTSVIGNQVNQYLFSPSSYTKIKKLSSTIQGVHGIDTTSYVSASAKPSANSFPPNTFLERYVVFNGTNTYIAQYAQASSGSAFRQNVHTDFELMVKRTLQFTGQ